MSTVICSAKRTAIGSFLGSLSSVPATELGSTALKAALESSGLRAELIDEVYMGNVLTSGLGQAPARQAALGAGLPDKTPCTTLGKVCGSGLKAVMLADLSIRAGESKAILAGGMESMSRAPHLIDGAREGLRLGHGKLVDSMIKDGLWDVYNNYHMGNATELLNREHQITREEQDAYAIESYRRANASIQAGLFKEEIAQVTIQSRKGDSEFLVDEEPGRGRPEKIPSLKPVFIPDGSVTAANASTLNDGAAALLLCDEEFARKEGLPILAKITAQSQAAQKPEWFTTAPAASIKMLMDKAPINKDEVDFWEINEAFSAVAIANLRLLELDPAKVNVRGGAVALGHPIGASGARILVTLLHTLRSEKKRWGVASLCIGGGEAVSLLVDTKIDG